MQSKKIKKDRQSNTNNKNDQERHIKELPYHFEKELINRQNKFIRSYEEFVPIPPTTTKLDNFYKFYAKQAQYKVSEDALRKYTALIERNNNNRDNGVPLYLESQSYGWYPMRPTYHNNVQKMKILNPILAPKRRCSLTIFNEHLHKEKITERDPFNGLQFIVY